MNKKPTLDIESFDYSVVKSDDESSRDVEMHSQQQRYFVDLKSTSTILMYSVNLQQNQNHQIHALHLHLDPNIQP